MGPKPALPKYIKVSVQAAEIQVGPIAILNAFLKITKALLFFLLSLELTYEVLCLNQETFNAFQRTIGLF